MSPLGKKEELTEESIGWAGDEGNENSKGRADQRAAATGNRPISLKNLFRAFPASTIRASSNRILSFVSWIHSRNRIRGRDGRSLDARNLLSSNSFHVTVKGKSPDLPGLWKRRRGDTSGRSWHLSWVYCFMHRMAIKDEFYIFDGNTCKEPAAKLTLTLNFKYFFFCIVLYSLQR